MINNTHTHTPQIKPDSVGNTDCDLTQGRKWLQMKDVFFCTK